MSKIINRILDVVDSFQDDLFSFIQRLVQTPSLPGKEQRAQQLVATKLKELGLDVNIVVSNYEELKSHPAFCNDNIPFNERNNVVACWKSVKKNHKNSCKNGNSLILNGHMDVVSPGREEMWEDSPWSGTIKGGKLYGRGSCDMKSGLASGIFAIAALKKVGFKPLNDIYIESVIGEESGGVGTLTTIVKGYSADAAIIMEPTRLRICPVQAGALTFRLKVYGKSIHASMKKFGVSAIEKFYLIYNALNDLEKQRHLNYHNSLYEESMNVAPINIGIIRGGTWHSIVPDELVVEGRYGVFPGESIKSAKKALADTIEQTADRDQWLKEHPPIIEWVEGQIESGETNLQEPIIQILSNNYQVVTGKNAELKGVTYGADLRLFTNHAKIPTVLFGPGNVMNAHSINEYVLLKEVIESTKTLALTIYEFVKE